MRLTIAIREEIAHEALKDWDKKNKGITRTELWALEHAFADYLYNLHFKKEIPDLAKLSHGFLRHDSSLKFMDADGDVRHVTLKTQRAVNWTYSPPILVRLERGSPQNKKYLKYSEKVIEHRNHDVARVQMQRDLMNVLNSVTTDTKLLEVWPESEKYLKRIKTTVGTALVPVGQILELNKALGIKIK